MWQLPALGSTLLFIQCNSESLHRSVHSRLVSLSASSSVRVFPPNLGTYQLLGIYFSCKNCIIFLTCTAPPLLSFGGSLKFLYPVLRKRLPLARIFPDPTQCNDRVWPEVCLSDLDWDSMLSQIQQQCYQVRVEVWTAFQIFIQGVGISCVSNRILTFVVAMSSRITAPCGRSEIRSLPHFSAISITFWTCPSERNWRIVSS